MLFRCQASRQLIRASQGIHTTVRHPSATPLAQRALSTTPSRQYPRKDSQDKDSLNPSRSEYTQSATDDAAAHNDDAAFNPNKTSPESEQKAAGEENSTNPMDVSPGNPEVSKPRGTDEGAPTKSPKQSSSTGGGSAPKAGGSKSG